MCSSPEAFYSSVEERDASKLCVWKGELYLELHRGTYTSQARVGLAVLMCGYYHLHASRCNVHVQDCVFNIAKLHVHVHVCGNVICATLMGIIAL